MNLQITILFITLLCCNTGWSKILIRGKILNYDGKSIVYYHPTIEGIYTPYWKEIKPSDNGTFKIEFQNEGYGNTKISYKNARYRFFHDTNSQIYFEIKEVPRVNKSGISRHKLFILNDSLKRASIVKLSGDYAAINKFYNTTLRSSYFTTQIVDGNYYSELIYKSANPSSALAILDSLKELEIAQINRLPGVIEFENPTTDKKRKEIHDFLINEVHAFYSAVFLNGMFLKRKDHAIKILNNPTETSNVYNHDWEVLIEKLREQAKTNLKPTPSSPDYIDFMESMAYTLANYKRYDLSQNPTTSLDDELTNRLFKYDTNIFFDKNARFAYELSGIHRFLNDQLYYSPALLHAVYSLQSKYPNSTHFDFYKEKIEKLQHSLEVSKLGFKNVKIINKRYDSFDDLLNQLTGRNILIDIWATWCHHCIEDFKHKAILEPFIETNKIEVLYISIDKPQWEDRWRQSIKINELQGTHFRADKRFVADMWNVIGDFKGAIPRYVLIDKEGKIFKSTAARPSDGNKLIQQLQVFLN